ncbi:hypothetical protein ACG0Z4_09240 [Enterocloster aldenensis]|uniref:hypothetical protein n=1 Tax=Enterocloster aldenensis TaxID=358742 RepID=UPI0040287951
MDKVVLKSKGGALTLVAESDWQCHVFFSKRSSFKKVYLGIASVEYVCSNLISGLSKKLMGGEGVYKHGDIDVFWIMSLFCGHASLYGNVSDMGFKLFCVEDGGHYLPTIALDQQYINDWVAQLSDFRLKYQSES